MTLREFTQPFENGMRVRHDAQARFTVTSGRTVLEDRVKGGRDQYEFNASGKDAERVLMLLWPFLSNPKRQQADLAIASVIRFSGI